MSKLEVGAKVVYAVGDYSNEVRTGEVVHLRYICEGAKAFVTIKSDNTGRKVERAESQLYVI